MNQITLTQEQIEKIEMLRNTTVAGNIQTQPKTFEQQTYQAIEYGIRALEMQRKQYQRQRAAVRAYSGK